MERALELAQLGKGWTSPNPLVGAVVVVDGRVVGSGYHERYGGPHAEVRALQAAGARAKGATLYVSLEPCCVWGKTPPCTDAIVRAGVRRVVVAVTDPNPLVSGRGIETLRRAGIDVTVGVLEREARAVNEAYFKFRKTGLPFVVLKLAASLDGRVAPPPGGPRWVSCEESRQRVQAMRAAADAVMVGIGTALADDPELTDRRPDARGRQPARIVVDSSLRLPLGSKLVATAREVRTVVAHAPGAAESRRAALEAAGVRTWQCPAAAGGIDLGAVLERAATEGMLEILAEGGPAIGTELLRAGLVDRLRLFVAPVLYGAGGKAAFEALGREWWNGERLGRIRWESVGRDVFVEADILPHPTGG